MSISLKELDNKVDNLKAQDIKLNNNTDLETQNTEIMSQLAGVTGQQNQLVDDTTTTKYQLGINNGLLYYKEVIE